MKTLLLIPSVLKTGIENDVAADRHPMMDYYALAAALSVDERDSVDIVDYKALKSETHPLVRLALKFGGNDAGLAAAGFVRRSQVDSIFSNGENVGIPLALMLKTVRRRPAHVTIGHRLSTGKKRFFFKLAKAHHQMDCIFVYAQTQLDFATASLNIPAKTLSLIPFHADANFYRPLPDVSANEQQICSAGLEWRDYPTLIDAMASLPDISVKIAAASPWSKHSDETAGRTLPENVDARRYEYGDLRTLYAESSFVVVPLYENDFQAGITTILEGMAVGKAIIVTKTTGQTDVIIDGVNGLTVAPGDVDGLRQAIIRLHEDTEFRAKLAMAARIWIEQNATLESWAQKIAKCLHDSAQNIR